MRSAQPHPCIDVFHSRHSCMVVHYLIYVVSLKLVSFIHSFISCTCLQMCIWQQTAVLVHSLSFASSIISSRLASFHSSRQSESPLMIATCGKRTAAHESRNNRNGQPLTRIACANRIFAHYINKCETNNRRSEPSQHKPTTANDNYMCKVDTRS